MQVPWALYPDLQGAVRVRLGAEAPQARPAGEEACRPETTSAPAPGPGGGVSPTEGAGPGTALCKGSHVSTPPARCSDPRAPRHPPSSSRVWALTPRGRRASPRPRGQPAGSGSHSPRPDLELSPPHLPSLPPPLLRSAERIPEETNLMPPSRDGETEAHGQVWEARSPSQLGTAPGPSAHLQHHAAERLPVGAHVQVHERVPGGRGRVAGAAAAAAAAAAGAGRGEAQRRGARDGEQAEQAGTAAQRQHRGCGSAWESGGRSGGGGSDGYARRDWSPPRPRAAVFIGRAGLEAPPPPALPAPSGPVRGRPLAALAGGTAGRLGWRSVSSLQPVPQGPERPEG